MFFPPEKVDNYVEEKKRNFCISMNKSYQILNNKYSVAIFIFICITTERDRLNNVYDQQLRRLLAVNKYGISN